MYLVFAFVFERECLPIEIADGVFRISGVAVDGQFEKLGAFKVAWQAAILRAAEFIRSLQARRASE